MTVISQLNHALAGRYEIEREIGAGGTATVFLARDFKHQRNVALNVLNPELGAVLGIERFLAEIRVTANLEHPNLLPLFDSGEADGLLETLTGDAEDDLESCRIVADIARLATRRIVRMQSPDHHRLLRTRRRHGRSKPAVRHVARRIR